MNRAVIGAAQRNSKFSLTLRPSVCVAPDCLRPQTRHAEAIGELRLTLSSFRFDVSVGEIVALEQQWFTLTFASA